MKHGIGELNEMNDFNQLLDDCPFCGGRPYIFGDEDCGYGVCCYDCNTLKGSGPFGINDFDTPEAAVRAWNRRSDMSEVGEINRILSDCYTTLCDYYDTTNNRVTKILELIEKTRETNGRKIILHVFSECCELFAKREDNNHFIHEALERIRAWRVRHDAE